MAFFAQLLKSYHFQVEGSELCRLAGEDCGTKPEGDSVLKRHVGQSSFGARDDSFMAFSRHADVRFHFSLFDLLYTILYIPCGNCRQKPLLGERGFFFGKLLDGAECIGAVLHYNVGG